MIEHRAETRSTNDDMRAAEAAGAAEGHWIRADRQTGGRGRLGRGWISPPGNLHASTLIRLQPGDPPPATLALVAAVALDELVAAYAGAGRVTIKWPNDLLLDGRKLSGILLERSGDAVIAGFGVNLAHHPDDLERPAASLGGGIDPASFCDELARAFARWLGRWRGEGLAPVRARWLERAHPVGTPLTARLADGETIEGLFEGLDAAGALRLRTRGDIVTITAGDVFLL